MSVLTNTSLMMVLNTLFVNSRYDSLHRLLYLTMLALALLSAKFMLREIIPNVPASVEMRYVKAQDLGLSFHATGDHPQYPEP